MPPSSETPPTQDSVVEPGAAPVPHQDGAWGGFDGALLLIFAAILTLIAAQNLWLRKRSREHP